MKVVGDFADMEIVNFAGCFIVRKVNGERVGGIYPTIEKAYDAAIKERRNYLGINVRERR